MSEQIIFNGSLRKEIHNCIHESWRQFNKGSRRLIFSQTCFLSHWKTLNRRGSNVCSRMEKFSRANPNYVVHVKETLSFPICNIGRWSDGVTDRVCCINSHTSDGSIQHRWCVDICGLLRHITQHFTRFQGIVPVPLSTKKS
jgi:hypothetical protein